MVLMIDIGSPVSLALRARAAGAEGPSWLTRPVSIYLGRNQLKKSALIIFIFRTVLYSITKHDDAAYRLQPTPAASPRTRNVSMGAGIQR